MTSYINLAPQNSTHTKEYGLNKPMPFSSDRTKVKAFLQECLVYINMNKEIYTMDKLKIGFFLSYMNKKEDPATGKLVYPTFSAFLTEVCKAFQSGLTPRCAMQIGKLETGKENGQTNSHRVQTADWTSGVDNKVDL